MSILNKKPKAIKEPSLKTKKGTKLPLEKDIEVVIEVEPITAEFYNGKKIISKGEVEINGKLVKTITTEEGSTYTI